MGTVGAMVTGQTVSIEVVTEMAGLSVSTSSGGRGGVPQVRAPRQRRQYPWWILAGHARLPAEPITATPCIPKYNLGSRDNPSVYMDVNGLGEPPNGTPHRH
jgi:hypothetical protein